MTRLHLVGLSGGTRRPSLTTALITVVAREVGRRQETNFELFDLTKLGAGIAAFTREELSQEVRDALGAIESADALIVGSPIRKGSYSGLFKHVVDFIDPLALAGMPVALTATGERRQDGVAIERELRPLMNYFSARIVPSSVFASEDDFEDGILVNEVVLARAGPVAEELAELAVAGRGLGQRARLGYAA